MYLSFSQCGVEEKKNSEREISNRRFEKSWNYHGSLQLCTLLLTPASRSKVQALWTQSKIKLPTWWFPKHPNDNKHIEESCWKEPKERCFQELTCFPFPPALGPAEEGGMTLPPSPVLNKSHFLLPFPLPSASLSSGQLSIPTLPLLLVCVTSKPHTWQTWGSSPALSIPAFIKLSWY